MLIIGLLIGLYVCESDTSAGRLKVPSRNIPQLQYHHLQDGKNLKCHKKRPNRMKNEY